MADGPDLALQAALVTRLTAVTAVTDLVDQRIYDSPPQAPDRPYLRFGDFDLAPERSDEGRTDWSVIFAIEVHSRPAQGRVEATRIAGAVREALDEQDANISPAGFDLRWLYFLTAVTERDADGKSHVARLAFEARLDTPSP